MNCAAGMKRKGHNPSAQIPGKCDVYADAITIAVAAVTFLA